MMHAMNSSETFLVAMLIIFSAPYLAWRLLRTDRYAPLVVVQIICGVLLGPGVLGAALPNAYGAIFTPQVIVMLGSIATWGVMMFVWVAGIELDLHLAWQRRRDTAITAASALLVPLALGSLAALVLIRTPGWTGAHGAPWQVVLGIGMACAVTALPILVLLMDKMAILRTPLGQRILGYASVDDVAIWGVLALILLDWNRVASQFGFILLFGPVALGVRWLIVRVSSADRWYLGLIWLAACGFAADYTGLHFMVGAFLAGATLDSDWFSREALDRFRDTLLLAVMPVFFLSTGLKTGWSVGGVAVFGAATLLLAAAVGGKLAGVHLAGRILGWRKGEAWTIGWLLQTKALIMIIFVNILLDKAIISSATFTALLLMAVVSTMLTTPIVAPLLQKKEAHASSGATDLH
jgi:Kef-type K+ transport system membrane component KefB